MFPENPENHLPTPLRESKLPWKPWMDDQARAPRPGDGWSASLGGLRLELELDEPLEFSDGEVREGTPAWSLALYDPHGRQVRSWTPPDLRSASLVADALVDLLLEQLRHEAQEGLRRAA